MATAADHVWMRRWWRVRGAWRAMKAWRRAAGAGESRHPFDQKHGVDTSGLIYADHLASGHAHDGQSAGYYATAPSLFRGAIIRWAETLAAFGLKLSDYTFVDVGCGKGRVVMLASEYAFREVGGVELNPQLAAVAEKNLRRWMRHTRACRHARIVQRDALSFPIPDGPVVLFFFNAFEGEMVRLWLDRLMSAAATRVEPIDLIYVHPEFGDCVRQTPGVQVLRDEAIAFSAEDAAADVFDVTVDRCAVFRLAGRLTRKGAAVTRPS